MKISRIAAVSVSGIAWALYGTVVQTTLCDLTSGQGTAFFILPSFQRIVLTLIAAQAFVYFLWFCISFLTRKFSNINLGEALEKSTANLYPSFYLFLLSGLFAPYISPLHKLSAFLLDIGPLFPSIILALIFLKGIKPKLGSGRLFKFISSTSERKLGLMLFVLVLVVYVFFTLRLVPPNAPQDKRYYLLTGDEPHYLLIVHSLVFDRDFNMYNNHVEGHSRIYLDRKVNGFSGGVGLFGKYAKGKGITATPEYWKDKQYSLCRLGLPLLLSPFYYLGYLWDHRIRLVVLLFLNVMTALLVWNIFHLTYYFVKSKSPAGAPVREKTAAIISALFFGLSMPVLFYSCRIYTEVIAALLVIYTFRKIIMQKTGIRDLLFMGLSIAYLPWLHDKYILFSALLLIMFFTRFRRNLKTPALILFGAPVLVSVGFLMIYYYLLFGVFYPINMHPGFSWTNFMNGFPGLILDQNHGLFAYSPFYLFAFCGAVFMLRLKRKDALWLAIFVLSFYIEMASFKEWWAGLCPPGRYLVPILGLLIPFTAYAICCCSRRAKWLYYMLGCLSVTLGCFSMWFSGRLYKYLHPFIPYTNWINLRGLFPEMLSPNTYDYRLLLGWFFVITVWTTWIVISRSNNKETGFRIKPLLYFFCMIIIIVLLRQDSVVPRSEYDSLMLYKKLIRKNNKVISVENSKPIYSIIENREDILGPFRITYEAEHLLHDKRNRVKETGNKMAVRGRTGKTQAGFLLWGPYRRFPAGRYEVKITMKAENVRGNSVPVAVFDVVSSKGRIVHAAKKISAKDLGTSDRYLEIVELLEIKTEVSDIEFRIHYSGNADVYIDKIDIIVLS